MSEVSNADIYNVLINMRGDMGRFEGKLEGFGLKLSDHIEDDKKQAAALQAIQISQARQRGFVAAISTIGAILGAALGAVADYFSRTHS